MPWLQSVVVNLRFDCAETRRLGVEGHVCELQLVPRAFMRPKQVRSFTVAIRAQRGSITSRQAPSTHTAIAD